MNLTTCPKGHHYNADFFQICPFCEDKQGGDSIPAGGAAWMQSAADLPLQPEPGIKGYAGGMPTAPVQPERFQSEQAGTGSLQRVPAQQSAAVSSGTVQTGPMQYNPDVHNMGIGSSLQTASGDRREAGYMVTGWLVCVAGPDRGKCYEVHYGENTIGRGKAMDIVLSDPAVSRDRQVILVYDERENRMIARMGKAKSLCYVDNEPVIMDRVLKDRSKLQTGRSILLFVALCREDFSWNMLP